MAEIGKLVRTDAELTLNLHGESLRITYDPSRLNAETEKQELEYIRRGERLGAQAFMLSTVVTSWDLTQEGEPYPITYESCVALGSEVTRYLTDALVFHAATNQLAYKPEQPEQPDKGADLARVTDRITKVAEGPQNGQNSPRTND